MITTHSIPPKIPLDAYFIINYRHNRTFRDAQNLLRYKFAVILYTNIPQTTNTLIAHYDSIRVGWNKKAPGSAVSAPPGAGTDDLMIISSASALDHNSCLKSSPYCLPGHNLIILTRQKQ